MTGSPSPGPRGRQRKAVLLRLDPELHDALAKWAADELRSTNAHVEWLLRRAVAAAGRGGGSGQPPSGEPASDGVARGDGVD